MKFNDNLVRFEESGTKVYIPTERYSFDLSLSENPLKFSSKVTEAINMYKDQVNHYPDPFHTELKEHLSNKYLLDKECFVFGAGIDGLIEDVVRVLINPGDEVVMPDLTFLNASFATTIAGGKVTFCPMREDFHVDFVSLKESITDKTRMVFLCNPNNPTGIVESKDNILDLVASTSSLVVVDEANIEFGGESVIELVSKFDNLLVLRSFSKGYGIAGLRIGFGVGNPMLSKYIWRLRPPFVPTLLSQKCALAALSDDTHIINSRLYVSQERNFLMHELMMRGFEIVESEANCFLLKVTPVFESSTVFNELLHQNDCTVVDGKFFRGLGLDYVRLAPQLHETNEAFLNIVDRLRGV